MNIYGFIFARGGSKGIPGKNLINFGGKPLIAWSIEQAKSIKEIKRLIVSTDSEDIANIAREYGAEVPFMRPPELAQDNSPEWLAWQHALKALNNTEGKIPEIMVSIPTTSPLRNTNDIKRSIEKYKKGGADVVITIKNPYRNPFFNMVCEEQNDTVRLVNQILPPIYNRQQAPKVFDMTTVCYVANTIFVLNNNSLFQGRVKSILVEEESAIDIDTIFDLKVAEFLLKNRNKPL